MRKKKIKPMRERDYRAAIPGGSHPWKVFEESLRKYGWALVRQDALPRYWTEEEFLEHMSQEGEFHTETEWEYAKTYWKNVYNALVNEGVIN